MTPGAVLALLACGASVAIIALDVANRGPQSPEAVPMIAAALWVLGVLILTPLGQVERNPLGIIAVVAYAVAFFFPAVTQRSSVVGYLAFYAGWVVVPLAWLANPAIVIALLLERSGRPTAAGVLAIIGFGLALTTLGLEWNGAAPGAGFWLWAAAPGLLGLGCVVEAAMLDRADARGRASP